MGLKTDAEVAGVGIVLVVLAAWYLKNKVVDGLGAGVDAIKDAAEATIPYINPADTHNVIYSGVNGIGGAVSGDSNWTLGGWIYDVTH